MADEERCACCGKTAPMTRYNVCEPCTAYNGWEPRCEACIAEDKQAGLRRDDHIATCGPGWRAANPRANHSKRVAYIAGEITDKLTALIMAGLEPSYADGFCSGLKRGRADPPVEASGDVAAALAYWREKLVRLDRMITEGAKSPFPGIRDAAELRRPERAHLAVLLRTLGVDIEELDEGNRDA